MGEQWLDEDEGLELKEKKQSLEELENELSHQELIEKALNKDKYQQRTQRIIRWVIAGVLIVLLGIAVFLFVYRPKVERKLPFGLDNIDNTTGQLGDADYKEGQYYIEPMNEIGKVIKSSNVLQTPSPYGYSVCSIEEGEELSIIGEAYENDTDKEINYFWVNYKGSNGFVSKANVDIVWQDDCEVEIPIEVTEQENIIEESKEFNEDELLKSLDQIAKDTEEIQKTMSEINEQLEQQNAEIEESEEMYYEE